MCRLCGTGHRSSAVALHHGRGKQAKAQGTRQRYATTEAPEAPAHGALVAVSVPGTVSMPTKPLRPCMTPRCPTLVASGRCPACQAPVRQHERRFARGETAYNTARWRRARAQFIAEHPYCVHKGQDSRCTLLTEVVDHRLPHRGDPVLFWDRANWQPLCHPCHNRKTATETGWHTGGGH